MRTVTEPVATEEGGDTILRHPAFGQIIVNKVSGSRALYGSDFEHNGYVSIAIHTSELHRDLSHDRPHSSLLPIVRIALSEAQWAAMVSSFGLGEGTQCTIERIGKESIPEFPLRDSGQLYKREADASLQKALACLDTLKADIEDATSAIPKGKRAALLARIGKAQRELASTLPFIADSFAEHIEKRVDKAKVEINAWMHNNVVRAGLASIAKDQPLAIKPPKDET